MRIEQVIASLPYAGMEMVVARLLRGLADRGHDVGVTCIESAGQLGDDLQTEGWRVTVVPTLGLMTNAAPRALAAWFSDLQPDVVHAHSGVWLKAARAARLACVKRIVHTVHGRNTVEPWYVSLYNRLAAHYTDVVVPVSETLAAHLRSCGVPAEKLRPILNGVSTKVFHPATGPALMRNKLGLRNDALIVGHVARFDPVKNQALLVDAFAILREQLPQAVLLIAGEGPLRGALEARIAGYGLQDHVKLLGLLRDPAELYREFDLFVLPSQIEGTSMSMLEAMATGVCCLATSVGGNPALLNHGACGILVPAGIDASSLAAAMEAALMDEAGRRKLGAAAREWVIRNHSEEAVLDQYERVYGVVQTRSRKRSTIEV